MDIQQVIYPEFKTYVGKTARSFGIVSGALWISKGAPSSGLLSDFFLGPFGGHKREPRTVGGLKRAL